MYGHYSKDAILTGVGMKIDSWIISYNVDYICSDEDIWWRGQLLYSSYCLPLNQLIALRATAKRFLFVCSNLLLANEADKGSEGLGDLCSPKLTRLTQPFSRMTHYWRGHFQSKELLRKGRYPERPHIINCDITKQHCHL